MRTKSAILATAVILLLGATPLTAASAQTPFVEPLNISAPVAGTEANLPEPPIHENSPASGGGDVVVPATDADAGQLREVMEKPGGISSNPVADHPEITVTLWPEEGLQRTVSTGGAASDRSALANEWACIMRIPNMAIVEGGLQWGAELSCEGDHAPSWAVVQLVDTCDGAFCFIYETKRGPYRTPANQDYLAVKKVSQITPCDNSESRRIQTRAKQYIDGVETTEWYSPDFTLDCHIFAIDE